MKTTRCKPGPWNIVADDFPAFGLPAEKWKFLIGYAVLAPSSHNSQPWLFHLQGAHLNLYADRSRACPAVDPLNRELLMSCGCALFHLRTAMRHFGHLGDVEILPDQNECDLVARLSLGSKGATSVEDELLFLAITKRRTNRQPFRDEPLPTSLLSALQKAAEKELATLKFAPDEETKHRLADLIAEGDRIQWSDKAFRHELAHWVHANHSKRRDGIPGYARGIGSLISCAGPLVVRTFDMGEGQAATDHELASGSPALAVLLTEGDLRRDWISSGQALARVLLRARVEDVWASFLNQPTEVACLRMNVPHIIGSPGFPQAILRFGFGDDINPTPRRKVEDLLI
jgi:hypothetical protein